MNTPQDKHPSLYQSYDINNDQESAEKPTKGFGSSLPQNERGGRWCSASLSNHAVEAREIQLNDDNDTLCSDTWICSAELEDSVWQQSSLGEYRQRGMRGGLRLAVRRRVVPPLSLLKSTPTLNSSLSITSQSCQFTQILETTTQSQESLKLLPQDFPARVHQTQEAEQDSNIQLRLFGEKDLDALSRLNPASVLLNNLKELSDEDFELFLADSLWQDTQQKLKQSRRESLGRVIKDEDCLSFPTLTSNARGTSRPAGQTKCEKWFKDNGLIKNGSQLGTKAIAKMMGFPSVWFEGLTERYSKNQTTPSQVKPQEESEQDISQDEQLHQHKHQSPSAESSTSQKLLGGVVCSPLSTEVSSSASQKLSIPCLVKRPKQAEVKGVIRKDEGDRFVVEVDGKVISVSKLFVYPDFDKTVEHIPPTKQATPPSKNPPIKTRRKKGDGTGYIYRRTVTRRGKQYQEAYFRYRDESGKLKAKYIPQRLLYKVEEAESAKKPIADILLLLGGTVQHFK